VTTVAAGSSVTLVAEFFEYAGGPPTDVTGLTITITPAAGGSPVLGPTSTGITHPNTGVYSYLWAVPADTDPGDYIASWSGTDDTAQSVEATEVVTVLAVTVVPDPFITNAQALEFLKKTGDTDDLSAWITAACEAIRQRIGHVTPVSVVEDFTDWCDPVILTQRPILEVTLVQRLPGLETIPQADPSTGTAGWIRKEASNSPIITYSTGWSGWLGSVRVAYRAGRDPIPGNITLAGLELIGHLWRQSQLNGDGGRPPLNTDDMPVMPGAAFALPIRVRELLGIGRDMFGDEVLIA
jgi:hypothetical protein